MHAPADFAALLTGPRPFLALAPMQEVTNGAFWGLMHQYGGADVYWTEYFRVQVESTPEKRILDSIAQNATGQPVVAQMIGNDIPELVRTAKELQQLPRRIDIMISLNRSGQVSVFRCHFFGSIIPISLLGWLKLQMLQRTAFPLGRCFRI